MLGWGLSGRPEFTSVEEMNETIIERHNTVVRPGDKVYWLGDIVMGKDRQEWMKHNWHRLGGRKRLVVGNHDNIGELFPYFSQVMADRTFKLATTTLILSHRPLHSAPLHRGRDDGGLMVNVHGHIHRKLIQDPHYFNACVEHSRYTPVNIDEIIERTRNV
jgi:calcineurin-like phosphoesterase family protein